jgi:hypothetical protein
MLMMDASSLAPAMAIARVAYEDGFLLDANLLSMSTECSL